MPTKISKNPLSIPEELRNWNTDLLGRLYELGIGEGTTPRSPKYNCMEYLEKFFKLRGQILTSFDLKVALKGYEDGFHERKVNLWEIRNRNLPKKEGQTISQVEEVIARQQEIYKQAYDQGRILRN